MNRSKSVPVLSRRALLLVVSLLSVPFSLYAGDESLQSLYKFQTKMAEQGSSEAMIKLGEMSEDGLGTEKSEERAIEWYQRALAKGHPDAQSHLDKLRTKQAARAAREQAAREQAAREQAAREQAAREQAAREQAAREQAIREQTAREQAAREQAEREEAAREEARKAMSPEEKARAREEAMRRADEAYKRSLEKKLEQEKAESEALKRSRSAAAKKK